MDTPELETTRFLMRKLRSDDAEALFSTFSDPKQCLYMSQPPFDDLEKFRDWLTDTEWPGRTWIPVDKTNGSIAGRFAAYPGRDMAVLEMSYITVSNRQQQGVASECMRALISHLFSTKNYRKLYLEIDARNAASVALAERLGFVREGCLREHEVTHAGSCNVYIYGMLEQEWVNKYGAL
ncbi:GNAT family N-acetyltransferase [Brucellaceae bacterium C25G]